VWRGDIENAFKLAKTVEALGQPFRHAPLRNSREDGDHDRGAEELPADVAHSVADSARRISSRSYRGIFTDERRERRSRVVARIRMMKWVAAAAYAAEPEQSFARFEEGSSSLSVGI